MKVKENKEEIKEEKKKRPGGDKKSHDPVRKKKEFLENLMETRGLLVLAAKKTGISYDLFLKWRNQDEEFKNQVYDLLDVCNENNLDLAEGKLYSSINSGNLTSILFFLKTKGKHRGYIERQEITGNSGEALFTQDALKKIAKELVEKE